MRGVLMLYWDGGTHTARDIGRLAEINLNSLHLAEKIQQHIEEKMYIEFKTQGK